MMNFEVDEAERVYQYQSLTLVAAKAEACEKLSQACSQRELRTRLLGPRTSKQTAKMEIESRI